MDELEEKRLIALRRYGLLDSPPEAIFDGITVAIANICEVPIALVSLVDTDRQWFKSAFGLRATQTPRDIAFCAHAIQQPDTLMVVEDAASDERFRGNPLVLEDPRIRFYAGKPIVTEDGYPLGTLCVIDQKPRQLLAHQIEALEALSKTVSAILDERHRLQMVAIDRDTTEELVRESEAKYYHLYQDAEVMLRGALYQLPTAAAMVNGKGIIVSSNAAWEQFTTSIGWSQTSLGGNIVQACKHKSSPLADRPIETESGLRIVLSGDDNQVEFEYPTVNGACTITVSSISPPGSGAIIQHFYSSNH
ncbi:GAF domain-containing protein [Pseudohalioglobus lutimaris]|nr:GAF domain-containing protein [Pseudohalioglobus lutimaris]